MRQNVKRVGGEVEFIPHTTISQTFFQKKKNNFSHYIYTDFSIFDYMTYKDYLKEKGFEYHKGRDEWNKYFGFGKKVTCYRICSTLFTVEVNKKEFYSEFVKDLDEFKNVIDKSLENV